jgi:hypothetical protein
VAVAACQWVHQQDSSLVNISVQVNQHNNVHQAAVLLLQALDEQLCQQFVHITGG